MAASAPLFGKPIRFSSARSPVTRARIGGGFEPCARGVRVPTSTKPKPSAPRPSKCSASLSSPAATPSGEGKLRPSALTRISSSSTCVRPRSHLRGRGRAVNTSRAVNVAACACSGEIRLRIRSKSCSYTRVTQSSFCRDLQEALTDAATELMPGAQLRLGLSGDCDRIDALGNGVLVSRVVVEPVLEVPCGHLRMELKPPGTVAETVCLQTARAGRERDGSGRQWNLVAVPLERGEAGPDRSEQRVGGALRGDLHLIPADLRMRELLRARSVGFGNQLGAEADAEQRHLVPERLHEEPLLGREPRVAVLLMRVGRTTEAHDRVIGARARRRFGLLRR